MEWDSLLEYVECTKDTQVPTPPHSEDGSPLLDKPTLLSVSTTFYPGAQLHSDTILLSSDAVFFYVHSQRLLDASDNNFHSLLPADDPESIIHAQDSSPILNIILHTIYDISCSHYSPSLQNIISAVTRLPYYGVHPKSVIAPSTPLFTLLLSYAPLYPIELYALAASFDLYDLAVTTSSHLLSFSLSSLTDDMAENIGPIYLKRLFFLHFGRIDALKRVLLSPPPPHPPTQSCHFADQKKVTRAWALASAYLAWDARPDLSTSSMESALAPLTEHLTCDQCRQVLTERIKTLVVQWSVVKRTI